MEYNLNKYNEEFVRKVDVHEILPQKEPFVMIGTLTHFEPMSSTTETLVAESNIFVENGTMSACGMIENIAQTCASRIGFYNKYILGGTIGIGFIGAIRDYEVKRLPRVGETITTTVDIIEEIFGMTLAQARIECDGQTIAGAQIKLSVGKQN